MTFTIEAYDRSGVVFLHLKDTTLEEVLTLARAALTNPETGGLVIYQPVAQGNKEGDRDEEGSDIR